MRRAITIHGEGTMSAPQPPQRKRCVEEIARVGAVSVVGFVDKKVLDEGYTVQVIGDALFDVVDRQERHRVLLDFSNVEFWSSGVLGKLITLYRKLQAVQGQLLLCNLHADVLDVFRITKLDRILPVVVDPERAGTASTLRNLFDDALGPIPFPAEWRTETVVALARGMHRSRDFSALPILADALQDAGCALDGLLARCRDEAAPLPHGWVVNLVLARE